MKMLTQYTKNGFNFILMRRCGMIAIFWGRKEGSAFANWEVIEIQSHNGREIAGKHFEPAEYPPSNEQWGVKGWTCTSQEEALAKFEEIMKITSEKASGMESR